MALSKMDSFSVSVLAEYLTIFRKILWAKNKYYKFFVSTCFLLPA